MTSRMTSARRRWFTGVTAALVAAGAAVGTLVPAAPASALDTGYQKLNPNAIVLYQAVNQPVANWTTFDANGQPIAKNPACPTFPGVHRTTKVWYDIYGKSDLSLNTDAYIKVRMNITTSYSPAVAAASAAYKQVGWDTSCAQRDSFDGVGVVNTLRQISCAANYPQQPARWCWLANNKPNDPALDMHLQEKCAQLPGGPYPTVWHEWHDAGGKLFDYNVVDKRILDISGYAVQAIATYFGAADVGKYLSKLIHIVPSKIPVYIDDVTVVGGVRNFDLASGQPAFGNTWLGYGHAQSPALSGAWMSWYDSAAMRLHDQNPANVPSPFVQPVIAHQAVDNAIAAGKAPLGSLDGTHWMTRATLTDAACAFSYRIRDLLDPFNGAVSYMGFGQDLQGLSAKLTGQTFCQRQIANGRLNFSRNGACNNLWMGLIFDRIDNDAWLNPTNSEVAQKFGVDLGSTRKQHLNRISRRFYELIG